MRKDYEVERVLKKYADTVRRLCLLHLKNHADTEDIFQTVFLKYALYQGIFESEEHEKAWLLRVTVNACHDLLRNLFRYRTVPIDVLSEEVMAITPEQSEVLSVVLTLPKKYKNVIYLHYYEGYTAGEIGKILGIKENTVYSLLSRGRAMLKKELGGDEV